MSANILVGEQGEWPRLTRAVARPAPTGHDRCDVPVKRDAVWRLLLPCRRQARLALGDDQCPAEGRDERKGSHRAGDSRARDTDDTPCLAWQALTTSC